MGNPRYWWAYADEDMMRIVKDIGLSCHAMHVPHMGLFKWLCDVFE